MYSIFETKPPEEIQSFEFRKVSNLEKISINEESVLNKIFPPDERPISKAVVDEAKTKTGFTFNFLTFNTKSFKSLKDWVESKK
jgi:hypothetical protein